MTVIEALFKHPYAPVTLISNLTGKAPRQIDREIRKIREEARACSCSASISHSELRDFIENP